MKACLDNGLPSCIKLLLMFVLMVMLLRRRVAVGYALLVGCVFIAIACWVPMRQLADALRSSRALPRTINLLALILLITFLGEVLRHVENLERLVRSVVGLVRSPKVALAALPAVVGLLPMPGGAMLSAPMVEEVSSSTDADGSRKTLVNYWFRHIWEYVCPLYPGIVLVSGMMGKSVLLFIVYNLPLTVAAVVAGALLCFRGVRSQGDPPEGGRGIVPLLGAVWPVGFVILCTAVPMILEASGVAVPRFASRASLIKWPLLGSICIVIVILYAVYRVGWTASRAMLAKSVTLELIALVCGIMLLESLLRATGAAKDVKQFLAWMNVPDLAVIFLVPLAIGLLTGVTTAYVGIAFAVLGAYLQMDDATVHHVRVMFAFASGFMGVMLSPVHLCLVLTLEYFKAERGAVYRKLVPLTAAVIGVAAMIAIVHAVVT